MTTDLLTALVTRTLFSVAPDLEGETVDPAVPFTEQFEFDSMDFLNFITGLHKATGLELPEADYPQLTTLDGAVGYLASKGVAPS
ncbi:MAG: acyl carrier protein [Alphaproteobacteria bacterium]|nr:acyl carrier protein [Alphaproteobacteria bacterium]